MSRMHLAYLAGTYVDSLTQLHDDLYIPVRRDMEGFHSLCYPTLSAVLCCLSSLDHRFCPYMYSTRRIKPQNCDREDAP